MAVRRLSPNSFPLCSPSGRSRMARRENFSSDPCGTYGLQRKPTPHTCAVDAADMRGYWLTTYRSYCLLSASALYPTQPAINDANDQNRHFNTAAHHSFGNRLCWVQTWFQASSARSDHCSERTGADTLAHFRQSGNEHFWRVALGKHCDVPQNYHRCGDAQSPH